MLNHPRDPALLPRLLWSGLLLLLLAPTLPLTGFNPLALLDGATLKTLAGFVAGFLPPASDAVFLSEVIRASVTTLAVATAGLALAILFGLPLAFVTTRALDRHALTGAAASRWAEAGKSLLRGLMVLLRGVPEIVWALLFVRAAGLGSLPAVLALGLAYGGMLGKVYAEILESQPRGIARALRATGAGRWQVLGYALLPQALPELVSYSVYRWECAIRASAVMGFVGAGGIGQLLDTSIKMMNGGEVSTLLLAFLLMVLATEGVSRLSRRLLESRQGGAVLVATALLAALASLAWLLPAWREAGFDGGSLLRFAGEFLPPNASPVLLADIGRGALETLAMALLGTALAFTGATLLALPASGRFGQALKALARLLLNLLRGIPDLLWASLAVLAVGLGPAAGVLALALHTSGVLGRLFAETLENAPPAPEQALRALGASRLGAFCYGLLPEVWAQWLAYALYRGENNIRAAAVLGIVGAGGLGQQLYLALSLFQLPTAASLILAMLLLSWLLEQLSRLLRQRLEAAAGHAA